jgi:glycosyltransferase involved in cell wall biosynthesis
MAGKRKDLIFVLSGYVGEMGGASKSTRLLCEALVQIGKDVRLFVSLPPDPATRKRLEAQNIEIVLPYVNKGWRWGVPRKLNAFRLFLQALRTRPILIHSYGLSAEAQYLLQLPHIAPIYLWESTEALPHVKFVNRKISRHIHKAVAVLAPSKTIASNVRVTYAYRGPIKLLPFWVDHPNRNGESAPQPRKKNLLYLGRFDGDKGLACLCEAFSQIQPMYPNANLTLCGQGDAELVRRLAMKNGAIQIRGHVSGIGLDEVINGCDALVLPSLHEGYPLSLLEACARGKPIISTAVGSIPELFSDRPCALLVRPGDPAALGQAMTRILSERDEVYERRCSDAIELFQEVSSTAVIHRNLIEAYGLLA